MIVPFLLLTLVFLLAAFPETQDAALATVGAIRQQQQSDGVDVPPHWRMEDHLEALKVRLQPVAELGGQLREAAQEVFKILWPGQVLPPDAEKLAKWLAAAPGRIDDWRASAARAGADEALSFVLSWYEEVELDQLSSRRAGVEAALDEEARKQRRARACAIAACAKYDEYIPDPDDEADEGTWSDDDADSAEGEGDEAGDGEGVPPAGGDEAGAGDAGASSSHA